MSALPAGSPFRENRDERRIRVVRHLVTCLEPLLVDKPYADLSVEHIIQAGSISRAAFYAYFDDKADLLTAIARELMDSLHGVGDLWWHMPDDAGRAELRDGLAHIVAVWRRHRIVLRAIAEGTLQHAGTRAVYDQLIASSVERTEAHIRAGQASGSIAPVDPRETAALLMFLAEKSLYEFVGVDDVRSDAEFLEPLTDIFWRTLYDGYR